jgi:hypothetical protein
MVRRDTIPIVDEDLRVDFDWGMGSKFIDAIADVDEHGQLYDPEPLPVERFAAMSNEEFVAMCDKIDQASTPSLRPLVAFQQLDRELTLRTYTGYDRPAWEQFGVDHAGEIYGGMIRASTNMFTFEGMSSFGRNKAITTIAPHFGWFVEMVVVDFNYRNVLNICVNSGRQKSMYLYVQDACSTSNDWRRLSTVGEYWGGRRYEVRLHRKLARLSGHVRILVYIEYSVGQEVINLDFGIQILYETSNRDLLHGNVLPGSIVQGPNRNRGVVALHRRNADELTDTFEDKEHDSSSEGYGIGMGHGDEEGEGYVISGLDQMLN